MTGHLLGVQTLAVGLRLDAALLQTALSAHVPDVGLDLFDGVLVEELPNALADSECEDAHALLVSKLLRLWMHLDMFLLFCLLLFLCF